MGTDVKDMKALIILGLGIAAALVFANQGAAQPSNNSSLGSANNRSLDALRTASQQQNYANVPTQESKGASASPKFEAISGKNWDAGTYNTGKGGNQLTISDASAGWKRLDVSSPLSKAADAINTLNRIGATNFPTLNVKKPANTTYVYNVGGEYHSYTPEQYAAVQARRTYSNTEVNRILSKPSSSTKSQTKAAKEVASSGGKKILSKTGAVLHARTS